MGCPTEVEIGKNLVFSICTHDPDTGVLTDADAVPDWWLYEDENNVEILSGTMAKFDSMTGHYTELVACTAGNGFEHGKNYTIFINATVDTDKGGISYNFIAYNNRISAEVDKTGFALSAAGNTAVIDEFETQAAADPTGFKVNVMEINDTPQTANDNGADINTLITQIGTAGDGLTGLPWNVAWDAEVQSEVADALDAAMPGAPTADSLNQFIQQLKWVLVNKMAITEANGNTVGYKDDDAAEAYNIAAAFDSAAGITTRKRLEP